MRNNKWKKRGLCIGRIAAGIGFCIALALVLVPIESTTASVTETLQLEPYQNSTAELPQVGQRLIPLGKTTGMKLFSKGPVVVGFSKLESSGTCPAKEGGLKEGDVLLELNGQPTGSNESLYALLGATDCEQAVFRVLRDEKEQTVSVRPVYDPTMKRYRIGAWIRDSIAGIGTITFVDPKTGVFGALGHGICDSDTGKLVDFGTGSVMSSSVDHVERSKAGSPGQLCGSFDLLRDQGFLASNTETGVYGRLSERTLYAAEEAVPIAEKENIREGPATILSSVSGMETREYDVQILKVYHTDGGRELLLEVTDPELLEVTGGIVQGQSGSPILQNGKLIGAVTHVLLKNPHRGYGISIETMLEQLPAA